MTERQKHTFIYRPGLGRLAHGIVESIVYRVYQPVSIGGVFFSLLPIAITVYACRTHLNERSRLFVLCFAGCALFNHAGLLLVIVTGFVWVFMAAPGFLVIAPFVLLALLAYIFILFISCLTLGKLRKEGGETTGDSSSIMLTAFCVGLIFLLCPVLTWTPSMLWGETSFSLGMRKDMQLITSDDCTLLTTTALSVRVSPDGKLIAMGGVEDLSVWDAEKRELLLKDTTISCRSVRFSESGKYLAAVGTAISRDQSCVVLYEVDGFKKLPQVSLSPDMRIGRKTVVLDVAFRPDEKSMIYAYYNYWDKEEIGDDNWAEFLKKENEKASAIFLKFDPTCHEVEIPSGKVRTTKQFTNLSLFTDAIESIQFSPDASVMAHIQCVEIDGRFWPIYKNFSFFDTRTWREKTVYQDDVEYKTNNRGKPLYVLDSWGQGKVYRLYDTTEDAGGGYVLAEFDVDGDRSRDIVSDKETDVSLSLCEAICVSPNENRILLCGGQYKEANDKFDAYLLVENLTREQKNTVRKIKFDPKLNSRWANRAAWLDENRVVVTTAKGILADKKAAGGMRLMEPRFFYVDVTETE